MILKFSHLEEETLRKWHVLKIWEISLFVFGLTEYYFKL